MCPQKLQFWISKEYLEPNRESRRPRFESRSRFGFFSWNLKKLIFYWFNTGKNEHTKLSLSLFVQQFLSSLNFKLLRLKCMEWCIFLRLLDPCINSLKVQMSTNSLKYYSIIVPPNYTCLKISIKVSDMSVCLRN